jgi:hypothetical protein
MVVYTFNNYSNSNLIREKRGVENIVGILRISCWRIQLEQKLRKWGL